jgi:hypothetical protein
MKSDADWLATEINKTSYKETSVTDGHLRFLKNMNDAVVPIFSLYRIIQQTFPNALGLYLKFGLYRIPVYSRFDLGSFHKLWYLDRKFNTYIKWRERGYPSYYLGQIPVNQEVQTSKKYNLSETIGNSTFSFH